MNLHPSVSAIRLFGSAARGDADGYSDVDVLVVQQQQISEGEKSAIEEELWQYGKRLSISWYSENALEKIYDAGHLFAIHLLKESKRFVDEPDFLDRLGTPKPYRSGEADIAGFQSILEGVTPSLLETARNAAFEAGLLYVIARNIAMIASSYLPAGPFFGRESPFQFAEETGIKFPLSKDQHRRNMLARTAGHRGGIVLADADEVRRMAEALRNWTLRVSAYTNEMGYADER